MSIIQRPFTSGPSSQPKAPSVSTKPASPLITPKERLKKPLPKPGIPSKPATPKTPAERRILQQKEMLEKKLKFVKKQLPRMGCLADAIRSAACKIAADDPVDIMTQITPLLRRMKIPTNKVINDKVKIVSKTFKRAIYYIPLRRDTDIDSNMIKGIQSQIKNFKSLGWAQVGLELWLDYDYNPPEEEEGIKVPPGII